MYEMAITARRQLRERARVQLLGVLQSPLSKCNIPCLSKVGMGAYGGWNSRHFRSCI